jgi:hypothetical protein
MKQRKGILPVLIIALLAGSCTIYTTVYTNRDQSVDFSKYKTIAWLPDSGGPAASDSLFNPLYDNDIIRNNAKNYINRCFIEKGYKVNIDTPDILLQLVLLNEKQERIITYPEYTFVPAPHIVYYCPYYNPHCHHFTYYGWGYRVYYWDTYPVTRKISYVKRTIIINVFDRVQKKLIWTASAEGDIYDPDYIKYDVHPAIYRMLQRFPIALPDRKPQRMEDI